MVSLRQLCSRLGGLFRRRALEAEMAEEMRQHLEHRTQENVEAGMTPEEARYAAQREFGGVAQVQERCRDERRFVWLEQFFQDARFAFRSWRKNPGFNMVVVLTLTLGIGACTAIFSIVDAVLLRPLPYRDAEAIVSLREVDPKGRQMTFAAANFLDVRASAQTLATAAQYVAGVTTVLGGREPARARVAYVSDEFFETLGVQPAVGRRFLREEARAGGPPVAVVSHGYWQRLLDGRGDLTATPLRVGDTSYTVVGVMPRSFNFPNNAEIWLPIEVFPPSLSRTSHGRSVVARLRDGVTLAEARTELRAIGEQLRREHGPEIDLADISARPLKDALVGGVNQSLILIQVAVGLLLLVACTNVANLLLARATARQREFAVRAALGATRWRLARQSVTEHLILASLAGCVGLVISFWGVAAFVNLNPGNLPRAGEISVNARVLGFTLALSALVALALGLLPWLRFGRRESQPGLRAAGRAQSADAGSLRARAILVMAQVALTLVLLLGAGLLVKSFVKVLEIEPGFRTERAVVMEISLSDEPPQRRASFYEQVLQRLAALPGITAVGGVNGLPMVGGGANGQFLIDNNPTLKGYAEFRVASPGYFNAMGMGLRSGRFFDQRDGPDTPHVALISESLARHHWPRESPLDQSIQYGNMDGDTRLLRVVGVVSDVREFGLEANARPTVYVHYLQRPRQAWGFAIVARTEGDAKMLIPAMRGAAQAIDRNVPLNFRTLDQVFSSSLDHRRFSLVIFGSFAAVALLLAALGIYGVTSYVVTQRRHEIGIRIALGARVADVLQLVIRQGMKSVVLGIAIGLGGAVTLTRLIQKLLFGVSPTDPLTFAVIPMLLAGVALLACYLPARRAAKVDPIAALRCE